MAKLEIVKMPDNAGYTLGDGKDESDEYAEWGEPLEATLGGKRYLALVDIDDEGNVINIGESMVYVIEPVPDADVEIVEESDDEDDDEEDDDDAVSDEEDDDEDEVEEDKGKQEVGK